MGEAKRRADAIKAGTPWPRDRARFGDVTTGTLAILNIGAGDTTLSFDPSKPSEVKRAGKIVADMLKRGFAILVEVGVKDGKPLYQRAEAFDPETAEYIIVGTPADERVPLVSATMRRRRGRPRTRIAAGSTRAVAVARSAGG